MIEGGKGVDEDDGGRNEWKCDEQEDPKHELHLRIETSVAMSSEHEAEAAKAES